MEEYFFTNPDNGDQIKVCLEQVLEVGIWRVYIEGDAGQKPLHAGANKAAARKVFNEVKEAMVARAGKV